MIKLATYIAIIALGCMLVSSVNGGGGLLIEQFHSLKENATKWSAEQITKNPKAWYSSAIRSLESWIDSDENAKFETDVNLYKNTRRLENSVAFHDTYKMELEHAKDAYRTADSWPVIYNGNSFTEDKMKDEIIMLHKNKSRFEKNRKVYLSHIEMLEMDNRKLNEEILWAREKKRDFNLAEELAPSSNNEFGLRLNTEKILELEAVDHAIKQQQLPQRHDDLNYDLSSNKRITFEEIMRDEK